MNIRRGETSSDGRVRRPRSVAALLAAAVVTLTACGATDTQEGTAGATHAAATPSASTRSTPARVTPSPSAAPVITSRIARTSEKIRFASRTISSSSLAKGVVRVQQVGRPGVRIKVYRVRLRNGVVRGRDLIRTIVIRQPVARVTVRGTHVDPPKPSKPPAPPAAPAPGAGCDSNYSGACVPVASDVDCAGGSGNGPAYVDGPVRVVGTDVYDLDRDGDGWGCD